MAVSGRRLGGSVQESDFLYDFPCAPCEKDGQNVEAVKFCVDCGENLCVTCIVHHKKFAVTRGHKVLDQVQTSQGQTKQLPSQRCSRHGGKIIDVFCPEHDTVGCSTCISVDHSSCKGKKFIPDVAAAFKTSRELKQLKSEMEALETKLTAFKKLKGDNVNRLKQDKDGLKKEIQSIRKKMNEQLDEMEKELLAEADTKFKEKIVAIHAGIAEVDDMLAKAKQAMDRLKGDTNDADIFVACKLMKQEVSEEIQPMLERIEDEAPERNLELQTDENAKLIMEGKRKYALINEKYEIHRAEYKEYINIRTNTDTKTCYGYAMCALPDGSIAMADTGNKALKRLDTVSNQVFTLVRLPDNPRDVCIVDNTRLAVSLYNQKKIQFVTLSGKATLGRSFSVGDRCRNISYCDGLLYVCCGGSRNADDKEGPGHVEVYNCAGELLRSLYEEFARPGYISVTKDGYSTTIYTADAYKGVFVRGVDGVIKHQYPTDLDTSLPFCLIGTDQLCIGDFTTRDIYIHTRTDKNILIEKKELKGQPTGLYYDKRSSQLFVVVNVGTDEDNIIKVFKLKM